MVRLLHEKGELNEYCLPKRQNLDTLVINDEEVSNEEQNEKRPDIIDKQIAICPCSLHDDNNNNCWHLYQIIMISSDGTIFRKELGFVVPFQMSNLCTFNIYDTNEIYTVKVVYVDEIDYNTYQSVINSFCPFLFEKIFTFDKETLKYDPCQSSYKMLPCLLDDLNRIDIVRMSEMIERAQITVKDNLNLNENDIYVYSVPNSNKKFSLILDPDTCDTSLKTGNSLAHNGETYVDFYKQKYGLILKHPDMPMVRLKFADRLTIHFLYRDHEISKKTKTSDHESMYYPIEMLTYAALNKQDFQLFNKIPSIFTRITQLYHIEHLRQYIGENLNHYKLSTVAAEDTSSVTFQDCLRNSVPHSSMNNNHVTSTIQTLKLPLIDLTYDNLLSTSLINHHNQLTPHILFQAITRRSTGEKTDMENLEILGDCFLKLAISLSMYYKYSQESAGYLTVNKTRFISNLTLYRQMIKKNLKSYLYTQKIVYRGKEANWLPPGYIVMKENIEESNNNNNNNIYELGNRRYVKQVAKRKAFADMAESLIGAILITSGYSSAMKFMNWLGLDVFPEDENGQIVSLPSIVCNDQCTSLINDFYHQNKFENVEQRLKYTFKNKAYLIAALTHPSNFANRLTVCYERLEFLGDAVLDYLVTREIFIKNENITPSIITDIRQDLANNGRLAYIFVALDLQSFILHHSPSLFVEISSYVSQFEQNESLDKRLNSNISSYADSRAPKALADVFEAIVGAIFFDSGNSLQIVWNVFEPFFRNYIERSMNSPNLNPIRYVTEHGGKVINENQDEQNGSVCIVEFLNGKKYEGTGKNKKLAKFDACRKAVMEMSNEQQ
ncbi:unnamed protein product [Didymodactylos carnosus]|uniref:Dicer-like protein n=1 Tax=Didymodactylos carnosus TaxID=1234261 RepID=A0A815FVA4_9BILA|nr:unnamed protein product [Didymodactylos carnosus]CAF4177637.1 unnamed protein product [Didymodactylos carnosus]